MARNQTTWIIALLCSIAAPCISAAEDPIDQVRKFRERRGADILRNFARHLVIPNLASDPDKLRKNAKRIHDAFRGRGVRTKLLEVPGAPPVVFGLLKAPGARRTLIFYAHYDGQPVELAKWSFPPFSPNLYSAAIEKGGRPIPFPNEGDPIDPEWRLYARSSADDKASIVAMLAALDAIREYDIPLTSNLKFFFEGEEESGSPHLKQILEKYRSEVEADAWIICDGPVHQSRRPQLVFGVRGITGLDITVYGAERYLHSGHYGNWAPNPAMMLSQLLSSVKNEAGRVLVEGFYDSVQPLTTAQREALGSVPRNGEAMRKEMGLLHSEANDAPYVERLLLPSFNVRGFVSATVGKTARNVIPTTAEASIDIRLVKGNDPEKMLDLVEAHIRKQGYHIVRDEPDHEMRLEYAKIIKVIRHRGYPAAQTPMDLPIVKEITRAAEKAAGESIIRLPTLGGSLPLYLFTDMLGKPVVIAPIANHDDNQHAPDENMRIANLWYGIDLMGALFTMP